MLALLVLALLVLALLVLVLSSRVAADCLRGEGKGALDTPSRTRLERFRHRLQPEPETGSFVVQFTDQRVEHVEFTEDSRD